MKLLIFQHYLNFIIFFMIFRTTRQPRRKPRTKPPQGPPEEEKVVGSGGRRGGKGTEGPPGATTTTLPPSESRSFFLTRNNVPNYLWDVGLVADQMLNCFLMISRKGSGVWWASPDPKYPQPGLFMEGLKKKYFYSHVVNKRLPPPPYQHWQIS